MKAKKKQKGGEGGSRGGGGNAKQTTLIVTLTLIAIAIPYPKKTSQHVPSYAKAIVEKYNHAGDVDKLLKAKK